MSFVLLGILNSQAAGGGAAFWLASFSADDGTNTEDARFRSIFVDDSDNIIAAGYNAAFGSIPYASNYAKLNSDGTLIKQQTVDAFTSSNEMAYGVTSSDSGDIVLGVEGVDNGICSIDSSGSSNFNLHINSVGGGSEEVFDIAYSNENGVDYFYLYGQQEEPANIIRGLLLKVDANGSVQWQRGFADGPNENYREPTFGKMIIDGNDVIISHKTDSNNVGLIRYNNSGTVQNGTSFGNNSSVDDASSIVQDSSGNYYLGGSPEHNDYILWKIDSSFNAVWGRQLSTGVGIVDLATDSQDNIYVLDEDTNVQKWDSSGNLVWQRNLDSNWFHPSLAVDSSDNLYIASGQADNVDNRSSQFVIKLPNDGSLSGSTFTAGKTTLNYTTTSFSVSNLSPNETTLSITSFPSGSSISSASVNLFTDSLASTIESI